jgi:hypothetical protein
VSLLGTLEQFRLPNVLQRIESHEKTGLLVVRQGGLWVEFYVRDGCLLCIGPVRTSATLGDRLVQDKLISQRIWQELRLNLGSDLQSEMRLAIKMMEWGYVTREQLRAWTTEKSLTVLCAILAWTSGEIYFEENTQPPADRLLVSLSITSLIEAANRHMPAPQTQPLQSVSAPPSPMNFKEDSTSFVDSTPHTSAATPTPSSLAFSQSAPVTPNADIAHVPTLTEAEQFFTEAVSASVSLPGASPETESLAPFLLNGNNDSGMSLPNTSEISFASLASVDDFSAAPPSIQPEIVRYPTPPKRIDTSFMQPAMVLVPADLSAFREQNPKVQITPDQWRILMCVDGCNSLHMTCQLLGLSPDVVCGLAGELVAEGLIYVVPPEQAQIEEPASNTRDLSVPGLVNAYIAPGHAASSVNPWSAAVPALPSPDALPNTSAALPFETESQWGNGGNGATFVPGRGWVTAPQPMQPLYSQGPLASPSGVYAGSRS